eukprot:364707-Chlamydomonas_euryale.AAC.5
MIPLSIRIGTLRVDWMPAAHILSSKSLSSGPEPARAVLAANDTLPGMEKAGLSAYTWGRLDPRGRSHGDASATNP